MSFANDDIKNAIVVGFNNLTIAGAGGVERGAGAKRAIVPEFKNNAGFGSDGIAVGIGETALKGENSAGADGGGGGGIGKVFAGFEDGLGIEAVGETGE